MEGNEDKEKKARICPLKEDRSLDLVTDDEFPGFLFLKISLFANNPSPRAPIINDMKFDEYLSFFFFQKRQNLLNIF